MRAFFVMLRFSLLALIAVAGALPASEFSKSTIPSKAVLGNFPQWTPENVVVKQTNDSLCVRTLQPLNVERTNDHPVCNWNCQACANNCAGRGLGYYCCENQWCCCYRYNTGSCKQSGVNCWANGCPGS